MSNLTTAEVLDELGPYLTVQSLLTFFMGALYGLAPGDSKRQRKIIRACIEVMESEKQ